MCLRLSVTAVQCHLAVSHYSTALSLTHTQITNLQKHTLIKKKVFVIVNKVIGVYLSNSKCMFISMPFLCNYL